MTRNSNEETVAIYYAENVAEADVIRARLEAAGIAASIVPSLLPSASAWHNVSSVRVLVSEKQVAEAQRLLQVEAADTTVS